jgi:hypothetical protein
MVILNRFPSHMARIGILSFDQNPTDKIYRFVSGTIASALCKDGSHRRVSKKVIVELVANTTPSSSPERYAARPKYGADVTNIPQLPTGIQSTLVLSYPIAGQSSYAKRDFNLMWGCEQLEWKRKIGAHD